jgi:hypothetical protein
MRVDIGLVLIHSHLPNEHVILISENENENGLVVWAHWIENGRITSTCRKYQLRLAENINCDWQQISTVIGSKYQLRLAANINCDWQKIPTVIHNKYRLRLAANMHCESQQISIVIKWHCLC